MKIKRKYNTRAKYCKINELHILVEHAERIGIPLAVFEKSLPKRFFSIITDTIYRNTIKTTKELALFEDVSEKGAQILLLKTIELYYKQLFYAIMSICNKREISNINLSTYEFTGINLGWEPRFMIYEKERPIAEQEFEIEQFYLHHFDRYQTDEELQEAHDLRNIAESIHLQLEVN